jgi:hypothetical protein
MSALPPKADIRSRDQDVCFGPMADIRRAPLPFLIPLGKILGLLQPGFAHAFKEFRHRAGGVGDISFDPSNRIFGV